MNTDFDLKYNLGIHFRKKFDRFDPKDERNLDLRSRRKRYAGNVIGIVYDYYVRSSKGLEWVRDLMQRVVKLSKQRNSSFEDG